MIETSPKGRESQFKHFKLDNFFFANSGVFCDMAKVSVGIHPI